MWPGGAVPAAFGPSGEAGEPLLLDHRQLGELAMIEFEPPDDLGPARGGVIYDEQVRSQHKVAWLVERANRGEVVLDVGGGTSKLSRGEEWPDPRARSRDARPRAVDPAPAFAHVAPV